MFFKKWVGGENYFLSLYNIQHVRQGKGKVEPCGGGFCGSSRQSATSPDSPQPCIRVVTVTPYQQKQAQASRQWSVGASKGQQSELRANRRTAARWLFPELLHEQMLFSMNCAGGFTLKFLKMKMNSLERKARTTAADDSSPPHNQKFFTSHVHLRAAGPWHSAWPPSAAPPLPSPIITFFLFLIHDSVNIPFCSFLFQLLAPELIAQKNWDPFYATHHSAFR